MSNMNHQYHLVNFSPWPLMGALGSFIFLSSIVKLFHNNLNYMLMIYGILIILLTMYQWWRDISRESTFQGMHTMKVMIGLKWGMFLFITSEIFFFISFFWAFFHLSLSSTIELGLIWPPTGIISFNPFKIPLLNTMILLTSGISLTWTHHSLLMKNFMQMYYSLMLTIMLGIYFSFLQLFEYLEAEFSMSDSCYGSTFFMATGFHGIHVIIGTLFLLICWIRHTKLHYSKYHHIGMEAAIWYWHFVDVIWLFLYLTIYWWGN